MKRFKYLALAALMAFAACDEGEDVVVVVTGSITGAVTIDGQAASGVTVSLSTGSTATTDGSGQYTFSNVEAGSYTVTISGFASDATFGSTSQAATISTSGQVVTVNFSGQFIKTSAIIGTVSAGGPLSGVVVSIGGGRTTTTDTNGVFSFSGLRAGSYTVTISGFNATIYIFTSTTQGVSVGVGESKVVNFSGALATTAKVAGSMFIDENVKNDTFDSTEPALAAAGVSITLEVSPGNTTTVETAADGSYVFENLAAGTYKVTINAADTDIPGSVVFGGTAAQLVTVTVGSTGTVNWPFDIKTQSISAYAMLGVDGVSVGHAPIKGWIIDLYDTDSNANVGGAAGRLAVDTTDANGQVVFRFLRANDKGPNGPVDNIVFARYRTPPPAGFNPNGEQIIEIPYNAIDSIGAAPDTIDARYNTVTIGVTGLEIDGDALENWKMQLQVNDTAAGAINSSTINKNGVAYFNVGIGGTIAAAFNDSLFFRIRTAQSLNNGHGWKQTPTAAAGVAVKRFLKDVHDGFTLPKDTVMVGVENLMYTDADIQVRMHHELDDSGEIGTFTVADNFAGLANYSAQLFGAGATAKATMSFGGATAGVLTFANVVTDSVYTLKARQDGSLGKTKLISEQSVTADLDGSDQTLFVDPLAGAGGKSTWAHKYLTSWVRGSVTAADGTNANGLKVRVMYAPTNIGGYQDTTVVVAGGNFTTSANLLDGPYIVTVADSSTSSGLVWSFFDTLKTASGPHPGTANNSDERTAPRDLNGSGDEAVVNFRAVRMNRSISGTVINDRDNDGNVIDPNEALEGAILELLQNKVVIATDTTNSVGAYSFTQLREGTYTVRWADGSPNATQDVLRALNTDSVIVTVNAAANVGTTSPNPLPGWNYATTTGTNLGMSHFAFLFKNTSATGKVTTGGGTAIPGMTVSLRRCNASSGATSPPVTVTLVVNCTTYLGTTVNAVTDASGNFSFTGLVEGVYEVTPAPTTVGGYTTSTPAQRLYLMVGSGDVENSTFVAS